MPLPMNSGLPAGGFDAEARRLQSALDKQQLENRYYGPNIESEIGHRNSLTKGQNITNEFLPEKLKQENVFSGLRNKWYEPNMQSEIGHRNASTNKLTQMLPHELTKIQQENQFAPLEMAIKSQNALNYGNRTGGVSTFLRGIAQMPVAERQAYLADPANRANYMQMLEEHRIGLNSPNSNANIITPEYVNSFGIGDKRQQGQQQIPQSKQMQNVEQKQQANLTQQDKADLKPIIDAPRNKEGTDISAIETLTPQQRQLYSAQLQTNNQRIGPKLKNRADGAIAFDKFMQLHRDKIGKVFKDAAKYNQLYGRGKNWMEKFKEDQPEEYANYITAKNSLTPLMANGIRFLEAMGESHEAQKDASNQVSQAVDKIDVSPETAIKVFNNHMEALSDLTKGILDTAEPDYPGVRKKLAGLKEFPKNFIDSDEKGDNKKLIKVKNRRTGEEKMVTPEEAKKMGAA